MKQVQFKYENSNLLGDILRRIGRFRGDRPLKLVFHVYSGQTDFEQLGVVCNLIVNVFPDALCVGCSSNGSSVGDRVSENSISIACSLFERESSQAEILQYALNGEIARTVAETIAREVDKRPWVTAIEILTASPEISYTDFYDGLKSLRKDVCVFGGVAGQAAEESSTYVFSNERGFSDESVVCVLYGGPDLHAESVKISGWKPLGKTFTVTKAQGNILWELDGLPAFEAYSKYLNIQNDYYFFNNTLEFPLFYTEDNEYLLRSPIACSEEGALLLSANMKNGSATRITYGDPQSIMDSVKWGVSKLADFCPDVIYMYSSLARKTFWGDEIAKNEVSPINAIAPAVGCFGAGQFIRSKKTVKLHNATLVVAGLREGELNPSKIKRTEQVNGTCAGKLSVITRLANFTNVSSAELVEMYNMMTKNSITDPLTGLYNRGEIQRRIEERFTESPNEPMSLVMIDIDNFKSVNDTYGHKEGDNVIVGLCKQIQMATFENAPDADAGRWGGEEFMIMLPDTNLKDAVVFAEIVRTGFSQVEFSAVGKKTISVGVTELRKKDTVDAVCVRVDEALYQAKRTGKNKVVVL